MLSEMTVLGIGEPQIGYKVVLTTLLPLNLWQWLIAVKTSIYLRAARKQMGTLLGMQGTMDWGGVDGQMGLGEI
jgi:hypothetical protein